MGGWGSGRKYGSKTTTSNYRKLDVRVLQRQGWLDVRYSVTITWTRNKQPDGTISIRPESHLVTLSYRHQRAGEDWKSKEYTVDLDRTACHYGGVRVWFRCPARGCGRRVAVLYGGGIFACRQCHGLAYDSQNESRSDRSDARAWAIRELCGGWGCLLDPVLRPKGMHLRTFRRLESEYSRIAHVSLIDFAKKARISLPEAAKMLNGDLPLP